ncbi:MAG: DUF551 domain-containing protein [Eubacteriales bacterium]|nr:DUF551 domain-containing protein [Eubacteriales bacterium]
MKCSRCGKERYAFQKVCSECMEQNGTSWISVKDRLPETDGIYIVCDRRLNGNPWIHTVGFKKASSSWCELHGVYYDDGYGRYSEQDKFNHWMPLPELPEEVE